ncbi:polycomb protein Sfmbt-like [Liolophura sinensis]|uniref:polycomb protein Sfmbt-like n=1 Tax=Liolophura sinensis TaxID=3198878 RepID=UPI0031598167
MARGRSRALPRPCDIRDSRPVKSGSSAQAPQSVRGPAGDGPSLTTVKASPAHIPRIISSDDDKQDKSSSVPQRKEKIVPELWSVFEVCQFLRTNDCGAYCDSFSKKNIDGPKFLTLTKEQIVNLTGMEVGPSLKIYDLNPAA